MTTSEGCAIVADVNGNLLFYTNGTTIRNKYHVSMANGTGLFWYQTTTQAAQIVKQISSISLYVVFTLGFNVSFFGNCNLFYSVLDISLATCNGLVVIKNTLLATGLTYKLAGIKHCNGSDYWIITHE